MADTVFAVEVGAKYSVSTQKLKTDIQSILNDISKTPPTVTVGLAKTSSKRQINADLNELFKDTGKTQYGITLGLKGGGNIRGSTGKAITKDLLAITSTLSQQQAAKVTVHIDTAATQKAMLAELKKLDLGVTITAGGQQTPQQQQRSQDQQAYNAALKTGIKLRTEELALRRQAETMDNSSQKWAETNRQANEKEAAYLKVRNDYLKTAGAQRLSKTGAGWDKEVREASRVENAYNAVKRASAGARDEQQKLAESVQKTDLSDAVRLQVEINKARAAQTKTAQGDSEWVVQQDIINRKQAEYNALLAKAADPAVFQSQVDGNKQVKDSLDQLAVARAKATKASNQDPMDRAVQLQVEINRLAAAQTKTTKNDPKWVEQQTAINNKMAEYTALQQKAADPAAFEAQVQGNEKVKKSLEQLKIAQGEAAKTQNSIDAQIDAAKAKLNEGSSTGLEYTQKFENLRKTLHDSGASATYASQEIKKLSREAKDAGAMAETAGEKFSRMLGTKIGYAAVGLLLNQVRNGLRQVYTNVVELDTGMTELKKVTDETDEAYQKFLDNAASRAKTLGSTMSNVVNATASFARLGYSLSEASELADAAVVYAHVGDEVESIDDASNSVISTMQAFGVEADNVMSIVDKFNQVGNTAPISSGGLGEAMRRSAAALNAAGNTIDESLALIAGANAIVQNPESVGGVRPAA